MKSDLLKSVIEGTGLPHSTVENELIVLIEQKKYKPDELTLEELREVMAEYINLVFLNIVDQELYHCSIND